MDVDCRWPGSMHDAKVFFNSKINKSLMNKTLPVKSKTLIPGLDPVPNYIIADPAYPLTSYCMKEYETCTNNEQVIFNNLLRSGRNQIECAFGCLKARWSILTRKINLKLEAVPIVVYACFALHNYCELSNCPLDENDVTEQIKLNRLSDEAQRNVVDPLFSYDAQDGKHFRSIITNYIKDNLPDHLTSYTHT